MTISFNDGVVVNVVIVVVEKRRRRCGRPFVPEVSALLTDRFFNGLEVELLKVSDVRIPVLVADILVFLFDLFDDLVPEASVSKILSVLVDSLIVEIRELGLKVQILEFAAARESASEADSLNEKVMGLQWQFVKGRLLE